MFWSHFVWDHVHPGKAKGKIILKAKVSKVQGNWQPLNQPEVARQSERSILGPCCDLPGSCTAVMEKNPRQRALSGFE